VLGGWGGEGKDQTFFIKGRNLTVSLRQNEGNCGSGETPICGIGRGTRWDLAAQNPLESRLGGDLSSVTILSEGDHAVLGNTTLGVQKKRGQPI